MVYGKSDQVPRADIPNQYLIFLKTAGFQSSFSMFFESKFELFATSTDFT